MTLPLFFFYVFSIIAVASALMVIASRNPVHSVLFLILCFVNAAGLFMLAGAEFLADLGLEDSGLDRIIRAGYGLLGLITYFTCGPKEARAWTIIKGTKAPGAAGVIHGDFERGFSAAETIGYEDYVAYKGEQGAKEVGKMKIEGKEYVVKDGDVMLFRFNV